MTTPAMSELPEPDYWSTRDDDTPLYTADQMRAYAIAALQSAQPAAAVSDEQRREDFMAGYAAAEQDATVCQVPPVGWRCTRKAGHDGPCAAAETDDADFVQRGMDRLREAHHGITQRADGGEAE